MAYDATRKCVVLFGGSVPDLKGLGGDTWEWDGRLWTQVEDSGPPPMAGHSMAYDTRHSYVLLYSGVGKSPGGPTSAWDGTAWKPLSRVGPRAYPLRSHSTWRGNGAHAVLIEVHGWPVSAERFQRCGHVGYRGHGCD